MDMKASKKLGLKERYNLMTRDLAWTPWPRGQGAVRAGCPARL